MKDVIKYLIGAIAVDVFVYLAIVAILIILWGDNMSNNEIRNTIKCLDLMCADLNDMHNDYDIPTVCEDRAHEMLKEALKDFNNSQTVWCAKLIPIKKGWMIHYE